MLPVAARAIASRSARAEGSGAPVGDATPVLSPASSARARGGSVGNRIPTTSKLPAATETAERGTRIERGRYYSS